MTTKYNPARTWTPENAVGIGGAYLCIYGMEGPGGYQLFGRTIQMWNRWRTTQCSTESRGCCGSSTAIRFLSRLEPRSCWRRARSSRTAAIRSDRDRGRFTLADHRRYLDANAKEIGAFKAAQQHAFEAERLRWKELGLDFYVVDADVPAAAGDDMSPTGMRAIYAPVTGNGLEDRG